MPVTQTFPQPDSPQANLGPRERALAVLKYVADLNPGVTNPHPRNPQYQPEIIPIFERLQFLYSTDVNAEVAAFETIQLLAPSWKDPAKHSMFKCLVHSFRQSERQRRGEPLEPSLVAALAPADTGV